MFTRREIIGGAAVAAVPLLESLRAVAAEARRVRITNIRNVSRDRYRHNGYVVNRVPDG
jgi:hypothetical protein